MMPAETAVPLSVKRMVLASVISVLGQLRAVLNLYCAEDRLGRQWQIGQMDPDRVRDCVADGRRKRNRGAFTGALGAERTAVLQGFDIFVDELARHIQK